MQTKRPRAARHVSSTDDKGTRGQTANRHKKTRKPDNLNHFLARLVAYPGAKDTLERLEADGMSREVTTAFLYAIAFSPDDLLVDELPDPENLRSVAARVLRIAEEISAIDRNVYLNPKRLLETYPGVDKAYAHMFALLPGALAAYSGYLQFATYLTGELGKTKLSTAKLFVVKMVMHAKETTGREHYDDIALWPPRMPAVVVT